MNKCLRKTQTYLLPEQLMAVENKISDPSTRELIFTAARYIRQLERKLGIEYGQVPRGNKVFYLINGMSLTATQAIKMYGAEGVIYKTVVSRLERGWGIIEALSTPHFKIATKRGRFRQIKRLTLREDYVNSQKEIDNRIGRSDSSTGSSPS